MSMTGWYLRYSLNVIFISLSLIPQCLAAVGRFMVAWKRALFASDTLYGLVLATLSYLLTSFCYVREDFFKYFPALESNYSMLLLSTPLGA